MLRSYVILIFVAVVSADAPNKGLYPQAAPSTSSAHDTYVNEKDVQPYHGQIIENPSYDPNLYTSFVPQDAVQQYVNSYGGPYAPVPGYSAYDPAGYTVQTGYEGFLVPTFPSAKVVDPYTFSGLTSTLYRAVLPLARTVIGILSRIGGVVLSVFGVIFFGGLLTTAVCAFTPLCSISFVSLPFLARLNSDASITQAIGAELTADRVKRAAEFVKLALEKYQKLQHEITQITSDNTDVAVEST